MSAQVTVDASLALKFASNALRQMPFAVNNALTRVANEAVVAGRQEVATKFQLRTQSVASRVKILQYSKPTNLTTIVGIDSRTKSGTPLLLSFFEQGEGGVKTGETGDGVAVPLTFVPGEMGPARPTFAQPVATPYRYKNLKLNHGKGRLRTYIVPGVGVFQRYGPKKRDTELVYLFEQSVPLRPRMKLRAVIVELFDKRFTEIFLEEFEKEIYARTAHLASK